jgi:hypothetical protein
MKIHYKTPICHRCDHKKHPGGKMIMQNDKLAIHTKEGEWICGVCVTEMNNKILEGMNRRKGILT